MRKKKTYQLLVSKMREVTVVPPQTVGPFTFLYKMLAPYLKHYPWFLASVTAFFTSLLIYLILGGALVGIVSILQFGF